MTIQRLNDKAEIPTTVLAIAAIAIALLDIFLRNPGLLSLAVLGAGAAIAWPQYRRFRGSLRWLPRFIMVGGVVMLAAVWLNYFALPADAQFFGKAEEFFGSGGLGVDQTATKMVFNVLRALYILYLAVAFVGVINAVRQDEDWQTVARTPVLVVVVVTVADVLTGLIVGTN
jgi:hypothetical protein